MRTCGRRQADKRSSATAFYIVLMLASGTALLMVLYVPDFISSPTAGTLTEQIIWSIIAGAGTITFIPILRRQTASLTEAGIGLLVSSAAMAWAFPQYFSIIRGLGFLGMALPAAGYMLNTSLWRERALGLAGVIGLPVMGCWADAWYAWVGLAAVVIASYASGVCRITSGMIGKTGLSEGDIKRRRWSLELFTTLLLTIAVLALAANIGLMLFGGYALR